MVTEFENLPAVDKNMDDTRCKLMRFIVGCVVGDSVRIEDHHIRIG